MCQMCEEYEAELKRMGIVGRTPADDASVTEPGDTVQPRKRPDRTDVAETEDAPS